MGSAGWLMRGGRRQGQRVRSRSGLPDPMRSVAAQPRYVAGGVFLFRAERRVLGGRSGVPLKEWPGAFKLLTVVAALSSVPVLLPLLPAQAQQGGAVLFQNVRIFDGKSDTLSASSNVLVRANRIEKISL